MPKIEGKYIKKTRDDAADFGTMLVEANERLVDELRARIAKLERAMYSAHHLLGSLSMGVEGHLRGRICTASNILGNAIGRQRSSHGNAEEERAAETQE